MSKTKTTKAPISAPTLNKNWIGSKSADTYAGGVGNDSIRGGGGDDRLAGGLGKDIFIFEKSRLANGHDTILDFTPANRSSSQADLLDLSLAIAARNVNAQTIGNYVWIVNGKLFVDPSGCGIQGGKGQHWATLNGLLDGDVINLRTACFTGNVKAYALGAPTIQLLNDSGTSATDQITNDASLAPPGGVVGMVEYSLDGTNWSSTYNKPTSDGIYTVQVRQSLAGQTSPVSTLTFTLDTDADVNNDLAVTFDDPNIDASEQGNITLTVTGLDDDIDLNQVTVTVTDANSNTANATYDATTKKWVVNGSSLVVGNLTANVSVTDIAGNTGTGTPDTGILADSPVVTAKQTFGYVENRLANSFIGTVVATGANDVISFRFWDPVNKTSGTTSADGFFTIDNTGKIRITDLGAASFANDADDTENNPDPINNHTYYIQASDADGDWSKAVDVILSEENCRCDDPNLTFLIDVTQAGTIQRTLENNKIYSDNIEIGPVDADKQIIRMNSNGLIDNNIYSSNASLTIKSTGDDMLLNGVVCIQVESQYSAFVDIDSLNTVRNGAVVNTDNFMSALEKLYVKSSGARGNTYVGIDSSGATNYMTALKDITVIGGGFGATLNIYQDVTTISEYDFQLDQYNFYNPSATAGDNFMASLQTISITSEGSGRSSIRGKGGDDMMSSLKSITIDAQKEVTLEIATDVLYKGGDSGYNGLNDNFLKSIEVIDLTSHTARMQVDFDARMTNDFMSSLKTINMKMQNAANFYVTSEGSSNVLGALENITLAPTTGPVSFSVVNRQYKDDLGVLNDANSFMIAVQEINITAVGAINFELRNGLLNYSTYTLGDSGTGFLSSLQNINVDAGTSNVAFKFFDAATDASSLSSLNSVNIKGGEIRAEFSKYMADEDWFNFAAIQGTSDGVVERWNFNGDLRNDVQVFSGFDAGSTDDKLSFAAFADSLDDLIIQSVGDDVQIKFVDPAITGEIWILDVAASFNATDNILL